jgi:hypothetical protein
MQPQQRVNEAAAPEANPAAMAWGVVFMRDRRTARYFQARMKPFLGQTKSLTRAIKPRTSRLLNMLPAPLRDPGFCVSNVARKVDLERQKTGADEPVAGDFRIENGAALPRWFCAKHLKENSPAS